MTYQDAITRIALRFKTGNHVPVESVRLTLEEWEAILEQDRFIDETMRQINDEARSLNQKLSELGVLLLNPAGGTK